MWFCFPVFIFSLASQKRSLSALVVPGRVGPRHRGARLITFSSALCWAPVSQAFQGGSSPFPLLQSSSPDSEGGEFTTAGFQCSDQDQHHSTSTNTSQTLSWKPIGIYASLYRNGLK